MTRKRSKASNGTPNKTANQKAVTLAAVNGSPQTVVKSRRDAEPGPHKSANTWSHRFSQMACQTAQLAGKPVAFLIAVSLVLLWAATGPLFNYSDTWQLVINTSTTIVTFLMVFLIQHTQNRDTLAIQLKLSELIIAVRNAENKVAVAEDLSDEDLEELHDEYRSRAEDTGGQLVRPRSERLKRAS